MIESCGLPFTFCEYDKCADKKYKNARLVFPRKGKAPKGALSTRRNCTCSPSANDVIEFSHITLCFNNRFTPIPFSFSYISKWYVEFSRKTFYCLITFIFDYTSIMYLSLDTQNYSRYFLSKISFVLQSYSSSRRKQEKNYLKFGSRSL